MTKTTDYTYSIETTDTPKHIFETLLNVRSWWSGLYGETIEGNTDKLGEEFTFKAGNGVHYSKQKLVEVVPDKKIVWLVTDSHLNFLEKPDEWTGTQISFDLLDHSGKTEVRFTHIGLVSRIECYDSCSSAWAQYLQQFLAPLITKVKQA